MSFPTSPLFAAEDAKAMGQPVRRRSTVVTGTKVELKAAGEMAPDPALGKIQGWATGYSVGLKNKKERALGPLAVLQKGRALFCSTRYLNGLFAAGGLGLVAVRVGVGLGGLASVMSGLMKMPLRGVSVMGGGFVISGFVMLGPLRDDAWKRCRDARQPWCDALQLAWTWSLLSLSYCLDQWAEVIFFPPANYYEMVWWRMPSGVCGFLVQGFSVFGLRRVFRVIGQRGFPQRR